jgi:hypothetical protein
MTKKDKTHVKSFPHDGSLRDSERALDEAKDFASDQYMARICSITQVIEVQYAGKFKVRGAE